MRTWPISKPGLLQNSLSRATVCSIVTAQQYRTSSPAATADGDIKRMAKWSTPSAHDNRQHTRPQYCMRSEQSRPLVTRATSRTCDPPWHPHSPLLTASPWTTPPWRPQTLWCPAWPPSLRGPAQPQHGMDLHHMCGIGAQTSWTPHLADPQLQMPNKDLC